jgi:hypothetical protein
LRVSPTDEIVGLDATQHGEIAYVFEGPIHDSDESRSGVNEMLPGTKTLAAVRMK